MEVKEFQNQQLDENGEPIEVESSKGMHIKLDNDWYITGDRYNPVTLVRLSKRYNKEGKRLVAHKYYYGKFGPAVSQWAEETTVENSRVQSLQKVANEIDEKIGNLEKMGFAKKEDNVDETDSQQVDQQD